MTDGNTARANDEEKIEILHWELLDPETCRYLIRVHIENDLGERLPEFAALAGNRLISHSCGNPNGPVMFTKTDDHTYEAEVCLCGVAANEPILVIVSEPILGGPEQPADACTFAVRAPEMGCPPCEGERHEMPAAARKAAPAVKAAKPAKAKPVKKPAPKKPAKPVKKVVAKKPAPKKPAKPAKKKPARRK